ncbi:taurine transporter ATP-binding subunit [Enterobacter cloacae]|uniref:Taurine transporter ATP-binding subunit n=1 Tax=Enterobacter cloacae TaxID=550 RepID=A0A377M689_ENTCL|nr:taurine transporter ATP-binding subunit [Enterobacter cloacae]
MLTITNLSADYGGKPALENINLTLESGELLVVLGPSGCGKTTLLNLIAGLCHISMAPFNWKVKSGGPGR